MKVLFKTLDHFVGQKELERLAKSEYAFIGGDATRDEVLREAGIERARGLIAAVGTDVDNTYITLSARGMRRDLYIEARASTPEAVTKLERSGADRVIMPHAIGGSRMAMLALRPAVVDFVDKVIFNRGIDIAGQRHILIASLEEDGYAAIRGLLLVRTRIAVQAQFQIRRDDQVLAAEQPHLVSYYAASFSDRMITKPCSLDLIRLSSRPSFRPVQWIRSC